MPNNNWDNLALWNDALGADLTSMSAAQVDGLAGKTVPKFATTGARDTAASAFVSAGGSLEGLWCFVTSKGFYGYNQGAWWLNGVKRLSYYSTISTSVAPGVDQLLGGWASQNGFIGNSSGIAVPDDGVYSATLTVSTFSAVVFNRYYVELQAAGRADRTPGFSTTVESRISVSMNAAAMGTSGTFACQFGHNYGGGGSLSITAALAVVRVAP